MVFVTKVHWCTLAFDTVWCSGGVQLHGGYNLMEIFMYFYGFATVTALALVGDPILHAFDGCGGI